MLPDDKEVRDMLERAVKAEKLSKGPASVQTR